jgi:predicted lipid-binding transport protein (Tim44 family)
MPRGGGSRSSSSNRSSTRGATATAKPPAQTQNAVQRPGMASGIMGSIMTGMAFGAASEAMRQLFRNETTGPYMLPLFLSGLTAFGANRLLFKYHPRKGLFTFAVFGGSYLVFYKLINREE